MYPSGQTVTAPPARRCRDPPVMLKLLLKALRSIRLDGEASDDAVDEAVDDVVDDAVDDAADDAAEE